MSLEDFFIEVGMKPNGFIFYYEFSKEYENWTEEEYDFYLQCDAELLREKGYSYTINSDGDRIYRKSGEVKE